ncbi:MAG: metallophosphoesterase, partial [Planctomycetota bacterium]|nr:metallophosphoesterase [Planctomycetota bacterium]
MSRTHNSFAHRSSPLAVILVLAAACIAAHAHEGRHVTRGAPHPAAPDETRFTTTRPEQVKLPLPGEEDAFFFVVFGDRTGGPAEGVKVLAEAVRDTNLLEPDLVMTVGDLVQGYNQTGEWMEQMREYKRIMNGLLMPWFPVAGNHDIYWRGPDRPEGEHEAHYEMHFGPLWYAFEHKNCWFIALYSDEGDPETGEKSISKPACQRMSDEQFNWLADTLEKAKDADHVFLFLHHPRWLGNNYGDHWERVHALLAEAGNVTAVFAGHIHKMRYDGPRDGIEYVTLATVGGHQPGLAPEAGYLHQFHVVTVRKRQIAMASIPVGEVTDVRALTGKVSEETGRLAGVRAAIDEPLRIASDGSASQIFSAIVTNPVTRPIEVTIAPTSADSRWFFTPDHNHATIKPGDSYTFRFRTERMADSLDCAFRTPALSLQMEYLAPSLRYAIPESVSDLPMVADLESPPRPAVEHVLVLDGEDDCLRVPNELLTVPDGPLTLECWFNAERYAERTGLVAKTENSDFGFFVNNGT